MFPSCACSVVIAPHLCLPRLTPAWLLGLFQCSILHQPRGQQGTVCPTEQLICWRSGVCRRGSCLQGSSPSGAQGSSCASGVAACLWGRWAARRSRSCCKALLLGSEFCCLTSACRAQLFFCASCQGSKIRGDSKRILLPVQEETTKT